MEHRDGGEFDDPGWGESSRFAAHLDRGWDLLDKGDLEGARTSAKEAQRLRTEDPDALLLLGAIALAEHRPEDGLQCYEQAAELDPEYLEPYAAAAQVCLLDLDDPARALSYCIGGLELEALQPPEALELHLTAAECELLLGRASAAHERLTDLPEIHVLHLALTHDESDTVALDLLRQSDPTVAAAIEFLAFDRDGEPLEADERQHRRQGLVPYALRLARIWVDLGNDEGALDLLRLVVDCFPQHADAWHLLGEIELWAGDAKGACEAALQTRRLDSQTSVPSWVPSPALLHARVLDLLRHCPVQTITDLVAGPFAVVIETLPPVELVLEGLDPRVPVLALASRAVHPDHAAGRDVSPQVTGLAIYRSNLARAVRHPEQLGSELQRFVLEELGSLLELDEAERNALARSASEGVPRGRDSGRGSHRRS